jgi:plastocyanin
VWDSGSVAPGGTFSMTFPTAGTFPYHCGIHPNMVGTVTVQ